MDVRPLAREDVRMTRAPPPSLWKVFGSTFVFGLFFGLFFGLYVVPAIFVVGWIFGLLLDWMFG
jgi:hypothetical protein